MTDGLASDAGDRPVALVVVSHHATLAEGVAELVATMAPTVPVVTAGGGPDGGVGTSYEAIEAAVHRALAAGPAVAVLYDLGSARLTSEMVIEDLGPADRARVALVDGPLVEGALSAALAAAGGAPLAAVVAAVAASGAAEAEVAPAVSPPRVSPPRVSPPAGHLRGGDVMPGPLASEGEAAWARIRVSDPVGLHARPAAAVVDAVSGFPGEVWVGRPAVGEGGPTGRASARSLLGLVGLAARQGETLEVEARGPGAAAMVAMLARLLGETRGGERPGEERPGGESGEGRARAAADRLPSAAADGTLPTRAAHGVVFSGGRTDSAGGFAPPGRIELVGRPGAPGRAAGPVARPGGGNDALAAEAASGEWGDVTDEELRRAVEEVRRSLRRRREAPGSTGEPAVLRGLAAAGLALLDDPELWRAVEEREACGRPPAVAWSEAVTAAANRLAAGPDPYLAERAADVRDVGAAVLGALGRRPSQEWSPGSVVVAEDISPAEVIAAAEAGVVGCALSAGSATSHALILARGLGLPVVIGLGPGLAELEEGLVVLVEGTEGRLVVRPGPEELAAEVADGDRSTSPSGSVTAGQNVPVAARREGRGRTARGRPVEVLVNAMTRREVEIGVAAGAVGVGLVRTEGLYVGLARLPTEAEQEDHLRGIFEAAAGRPVTVRTLDLGGDKQLPALGLDPLRHGPLGERGSRLVLSRPHLLDAQLRALSRAAVGHRVRVLFPMITRPEEIVALRERLADVARRLEEAGERPAEIEAVGVMVEVPVVALDPTPYLELVDFCSIGGNDLAGYVLAADRAEPAVADYYRRDHPVVFDLVARVVEAADRLGRPVGFCGELAAEPDAAGRLVELGVRELSVAASAVGRLRRALAL